MMQIRWLLVLSFTLFSCQESKAPVKVHAPDNPETDQAQEPTSKDLKDLEIYLKLSNQTLKKPGTWSELEVLPWPTYGIGRGLREQPFSSPYQMDQFFDVALRWIDKQSFQGAGKIEFISKKGITFSLPASAIKVDSYFKEYLKPDSAPDSEEEIWSVYLPLVKAPPFSGETWTVKVFHGSTLVKNQDFKLGQGFMVGHLAGYSTKAPSLIYNSQDFPKTEREASFLFIDWQTKERCFLVLYEQSKKRSSAEELWIPLALGELKEPAQSPWGCQWNLDKEKKYLLVATNNPKTISKYDLTSGLKL